MRLSLLSVVVVVLATSFARADDAPKPRVAIKVFSVADLAMPVAASEVEVAPAPRVASTPVRVNSVIHLRNVAAADVADAINRFLENHNQGAATVVAEPVSNTVLVSAEPSVAKQVTTLLAALDVAPVQTQIDAMIVEVPEGFLSNTGLKEEAGKPLVLTPRELAMFQAAIRKEKQNGSIDILSRPQISVAENQTGMVQIGGVAQIPVGLELTPTVAQGVQGLSVTRKMVPVEQGVRIAVTPRIEPSGDSMLLRVVTSVSTVTEGAATVPLTLPPEITGLKKPVTYHVPTLGAVNVETRQATIQMTNGQTLILRASVRKEKGAGATRETLVILTPHRVKDEPVQPAARVQPTPVALMVVPSLAPSLLTQPPAIPSVAAPVTQPTPPAPAVPLPAPRSSR